MVTSPDNAAENPVEVGGHVPGEPGIWIVLFGDMAVFTILFGVYLHARGADKQLFTESQHSLNQNLGAANTVVLLTSSLLVVFALLSLRCEQHRYLAPRFTIAGIVVGCGFVVIKVFEYHEKIVAGITPATNDFFMYYFVLTGLHLAHVIVGLAVLVALSILARKRAPTRSQIALFEGGSCFWHMVDLLWIVIFPLLFLVR